MKRGSISAVGRTLTSINPQTQSETHPSACCVKALKCLKVGKNVETEFGCVFFWTVVQLYVDK